MCVYVLIPFPRRVSVTRSTCICFPPPDESSKQISELSWTSLSVGYDGTHQHQYAHA